MASRKVTMVRIDIQCNHSASSNDFNGVENPGLLYIDGCIVKFLYMNTVTRTIKQGI